MQWKYWQTALKLHLFRKQLKPKHFRHVRIHWLMKMSLEIAATLLQEWNNQSQSHKLIRSRGNDVMILDALEEVRNGPESVPKVDQNWNNNTVIKIIHSVDSESGERVRIAWELLSKRAKSETINQTELISPCHWFRGRETRWDCSVIAGKIAGKEGQKNESRLQYRFPARQRNRNTEKEKEKLARLGKRCKNPSSKTPPNRCNRLALKSLCNSPQAILKSWQIKYWKMNANCLEIALQLPWNSTETAVRSPWYCP